MADTKVLTIFDMSDKPYNYNVDGAMQMPALNTTFITFKTTDGKVIAWSIQDISHIEL